MPSVILTGQPKRREPGEPPDLGPFLAEYGGQAAALPDIAGKYAGKQLVVCGDAACIWDDLERLGCRVNGGNARRGAVGGPWDFLTINKVVETFPGNIEHAYSNEWALLERFIACRRSEYKKEFDGPRHTHSRGSSGAKWNWPWSGHATSGLGATLVGMWLGYDRIVLCGVPLDDGPHNGEPHWRRCTFSREAADSMDSGMNRYWQRARDLAFQGRVKSMSGRTREWLGSP
jgi:hypothetical protein